MNKDLNEPSPVIALLCDASGEIRKVVRDDFGLGGDALIGSMFSILFDQGSRRKARLFLDVLRMEKATFDWELNVAQGGAIKSLFFAGVTSAEGAHVVGAVARDQIYQLYEELMQIGNEQLTGLRFAAKQGADGNQSYNHQARLMQDEFTRLNNELVNAQRELQRNNHELSRLGEQKSRFIGMASHDLRNPLGVILNSTELLQSSLDQKLSDDERELLDLIQSSTSYMMHLVQSFLDLTHIEAGQLNVELQSTDPARLMADIAASYRVTAKGKGITLETDVTDNLPTMMLDGYKMQQAIGNLVSNGIKFSEPGKSVTLRASVEADQLIIAVEDLGPGIPQDEIKNLFKPFTRTSVRPTAGERSSGLGLSIAEAMIKLHQGTIDVKSRPGQGTTFTISLPIHKPEHA